MPIVGVNINEIYAKINDENRTGHVEIKSTPKVEDVERREFLFAGMKEAIIIKFSFKTVYEPEVAEISFNGDIIFQAEDAKKFMKYWKENKKLEDEIMVEVLNAIFRKCMSKGMQIADDLRLPPPIAFPIVEPKKNEVKK